MSFPYIDFPLDHSAAQRVLEKLRVKGPLIEVERSGEHPTAECYQNVTRQIAKVGGDILLGWAVEYVPGVIIRMMHHAVWQASDGGLRDITAPQRKSVLRSGKTTFVRDNVVAIDYDYPIPVKDEYLLLRDETDLRKMLRFYRASITAKQTVLLRQKSGGLLLPTDPVAQWFRKADEERAEFEASMCRKYCGRMP